MNTGPGQGARGPSSLPNWWPADPRHTSSTTSDVMSQLCRVCGEPAAGFHFGAFTCEGCKSFFGRTYNNLSSISECKNNGECVINKKNRTSCKACRLRKCLVVGMSKSGSRYGRRSNWFKIHCLLQEQHQQHHQQQHVQHQHQHQQQQHVQQHVQPAGLLGMGLQQQFQQHRQHVQHQQQRSAAAGRPSFEPGPPPPPPPLLPWADVKHHLRLDADNNNSVAGDLNKDGGRLSAAAVVAQAVRPDVLRWPSPFFPAFPFPSAAPFFLAMQPQALHRALRSPGSPPPGSSTVPAAAAAENEDDDDQDDDDQDDDDQDDQDGPLSDERVPFRRGSLPPVQESPMDLSVSASSPPRPRPPSPRVADGPRPTDRCCLRRQRRRRRRRRRRREPSDGRRTSDACADAAARGVTSAGSTGSESEDGPGARPPKNAPLDLTCDRSS